MRAPKSKYVLAPYTAVPAATRPSTNPVCLTFGARRARPAATQATAVAAKYVTSSSVDVLGLIAIDSSTSTQTNAQTHGASVTKRMRSLSDPAYVHSGCSPIEARVATRIVRQK